MMIVVVAALLGYSSEKKLTCYSVAIIVTHEFDGRVDHIEWDVKAGLILSLQTTTRGFQKILYTWPRFINRSPDKKGGEKKEKINHYYKVSVSYILHARNSLTSLCNFQKVDQI